MEAQLARLEAKLETGFISTHRRLDELTSYQREMNGKVGRAHERLSEHDGTIAALTRRLGEVAEGVHRKFNDMLRRQDRRSTDSGDFERQAVSVGMLWKFAVAIVGTVIATYTVLTVLGWQHP